MPTALKRFLFGSTYVRMEQDRQKLRALAMQRHPSNQPTTERRTHDS